MVWPTNGNFNPAMLASATIAPATGRPEIYKAMLDLKDAIASRGQASGIAALDGSAKITVSQIPTIPASLIGTGTAAEKLAACANLGAQAALGYTPVNKAGDSMSGSLAVQCAGAMITLVSSTIQPSFMFWNNKLAPANGDVVGEVQFQGNDSFGGVNYYARMRGTIVDKTFNAWEGKLAFGVVSPTTRYMVESFTIRHDGIELLGPAGVPGKITSGGYTVLGSDRAGYFYNRLSLGANDGAGITHNLNIYGPIANKYMNLAMSSGNGLLQAIGGGYMIVSSATGALWLGSAQNQPMFIDAGGYISVRDCDAANVARLSVDTATGNVWIDGDFSQDIEQGHYFGSSTIDGSWRMRVLSGNFVIEKRVAGAWTVKQTFA